MKWTLNKIAKEISSRGAASQYRAKKVINALLDIIEEGLSEGDEIYLQRLGKLHTYKINWRLPTEKKWYEIFEPSEKSGTTCGPALRFSRYLKNKIKASKN